MSTLPLFFPHNIFCKSSIKAHLRKALLLISLFSGGSALADSPRPLEVDIAGTEIEDLLNMTITSASKIAETIKKTPAAVFVLTAEDIQRSGATSIPEALRLVPGVQVARVDANKWAVTMRGFNNRAANKLLVMIDGRTIYDPLFSGVLWETKDVFLEDVERIEVIRGPGGSTWGANAVNGVINIITKHTKDTKGGLVTAGGGSEERGFFNARYGGEISNNTLYRVYGKYYNRDKGYLAEGSEDDSYQGEGGFRLDSNVGEDSTFMLQGGVYNGDHDGPTATDDVHGKGHSIIGKWEKNLPNNSQLNVQSFYDYSDFESSIFNEERDTFEFDLNHIFHYDAFQFIHGASYRYTSDELENSPILALEPKHRVSSLGAIFSKVQWAIVEKVLDFQVGAKLEHNDFSGLEVQPDIGFTWSATTNNVIWGKISKAVRTPSRLENDLRITFPDGTPFLVGNNLLKSESLVAYEVGYRAIPFASVFIDISTFYNNYDHLVSAEGLTLGNLAEGDTHGVEVAGTWKASSWWQFKGTYTYLQTSFELDPDSIANPLTIAALQGNSPHHQASFASSVALSDQWNFDFDVRYVDSLSLPHVSSYIVSDIRLAWKALESLEFALVGQNLFDKRHFEQGSGASSEVEQGVYGKVTWLF